MPPPGELPGLPVGVPGPTESTLVPRPWEQDRDAPPLDDDGAFDWRITAAAFGFLWAAFTSLVMSVAPPTWGGVVAWFIATAAMGGEVVRQRVRWRRLEDRQNALGASLPGSSSTALPSAPLEAVEEGLPPRDVDRVEEGLDKDPA